MRKTIPVRCGFQSFHFNRSRIDPFAVDGSTTAPFCKITILPFSTSLLAALRTLSIFFRQSPSRKYSLATSLGQAVEVRERSPNMSRIAFSRSSSIPDGFFFRQAAEQYFTSSQQSSHFFLQEINRPQLAQIFCP
jgi:hypothetical protein